MNKILDFNSFLNDETLEQLTSGVMQHYIQLCTTRQHLPVR
jgi:hypothetical protein